MTPPSRMGDFLGVSASLTGRRWVAPTAEVQRRSEALAQQNDLPLAIARVLAARGVEASAVEEFLSPTLRALLPDPRGLRDMPQAAQRLTTAAARAEKVAIFADYDVDGAASAALLHDWFTHHGVRPTLYVPDRIEEGYGPNAPAMAKLAADHDLIICVDCGTLSLGPIAAAKDADVLVLDHHLGGETLPDALAVVNPNRQDETGDLAHLCAATVVFLTLVEANRLDRELDRQGPNLMDSLDLVALATVADVAPLIGVNRALVRQGLVVMARRARPGLVALGDISGVNGPPTSHHLGFALGPRINAGGRIGRPDLGARLLCTTDPHEAQALAERLDKLNEERQQIEATVREAAMAQAQTRGLDGPLVWAAGEGWHPGVVGITAARMKETMNRPAIVIGLEGGEGKGSGRSMPGIDLGAAIHRLATEGHILKGGGHKMAAGLSVARDKLEPAMERLAELLGKQGAGALGPRDLPCAALLSPEAASVDLVEMLEKAGPFGAGAPAPRFVFADVSIRFAKKVGSGHLKLSFAGDTGARCEAIAFGALDGPMGPPLLNHGGARFHLAGRLEINHWQGRKTVQLRLEDAAPAGT